MTATPMRMRDMQPASLQDIKDQATRLRRHLPPEVNITHAQSLELIAKLHGFMGWGCLRAMLTEVGPGTSAEIYSENGFQDIEDKGQSDLVTIRGILPDRVHSIILNHLRAAGLTDDICRQHARVIVDIINQGRSDHIGPFDLDASILSAFGRSHEREREILVACMKDVAMNEKDLFLPGETRQFMPRMLNPLDAFDELWGNLEDVKGNNLHLSILTDSREDLASVMEVGSEIVFLDPYKHNIISESDGYLDPIERLLAPRPDFRKISNPFDMLKYVMATSGEGLDRPDTIKETPVLSVALVCDASIKGYDIMMALARSYRIKLTMILPRPDINDGPAFRSILANSQNIIVATETCIPSDLADHLGVPFGRNHTGFGLVRKRPDL